MDPEGKPQTNDGWMAYPGSFIVSQLEDDVRAVALEGSGSDLCMIVLDKYAPVSPFSWFSTVFQTAELQSIL